MTKLTIVCGDWRPRRKNTLLGFARIEIVELDLTIHDVAVHAKNDRAWAQLPGRPWVEDDRLVRGDDGKVEYSQILEFGRKEVRDAFSAAVIRAVCERYPDALKRETEAAT